MRTTDLKDLKDTVERVRQEQYPDLDSGFLAAVVEIEEQNPEPEDDDAAMRAILAALRTLLLGEGDN
ncbi:hypothetical protein [Streptosporangium sandarakinum]